MRDLQKIPTKLAYSMNIGQIFAYVCVLDSAFLLSSNRIMNSTGIRIVPLGI